jgi:hypothetical protein
LTLPMSRSFSSQMMEPSSRPLVGKSKAMQEVYRLIDLAAPTTAGEAFSRYYRSAQARGAPGRHEGSALPASPERPPESRIALPR